MNSRNVLKAGLLLGLAAIILIAFMPVVSGEQVEVYGRMKDGSNAMIVDASIVAYNVGTETEYETTSTDNGGSFEMTVPSGGYVFTFSMYEFSTEYAWFEVEGDDEDEMGLGIFYLTSLETDSTLNGTINSSKDGEAVKNVNVWVHYPEQDYTTGAVQTDVDGWFEIDFNSAEEAWLVWDKNGFTFNTTEILAPYNQTFLDIDPIDEDDYHLVEGTIVDSSNPTDDIEGAKITLWNNDMSLWIDADYASQTGLTDDHGYRGFEVIEGTYTLLVEAEGYEDYIDTNFNVPDDRALGPGDTDPLALDPSEDGISTITIDFDSVWNASVFVDEDINDDQDVWDHNWDYALYDLWTDHGYGRVGPNAIAGTTLGDSDLTASEFVLVEDLYDYQGVPEMYLDLIEIVNGSAVDYDSVLVDSVVNTTDWWITWDMDFTRTEGFDNVDVRFKTVVSYDTDLDYTYSYDLPDGWYMVANDSVEDVTVTGTVDGFDIDPGMSDGMSAMIWIDISNDDGDPVAEFTIENFLEEDSDETVDEGVHVEFNATGSHDNGTYQSGIEEYRWDFGDGETLNTTNDMIDYKYDVPGVYTVILTVVDGADKESAAVTYMLTINDVTKPDVEVIPPWAPWEVNLTDVNGTTEDITVNITDTESVSEWFNITAIIKPAGSLEEDWTTMEWNEEEATDGNLTFIFNWTFVEPGNYTIVIEATDDSNNTGEGSDGLTVVDMIAPVPNFIAQNKSLGILDMGELIENDEIIFNASIDSYTTDENVTVDLTVENDRILTCFWDFGDGTYDNETGDDSDGSDDNSIVSHVYHEPGTFVVNVTVRDNWKNSAWIVMNVTVIDTVAPEAKFSISVWGEDAEKFKDGSSVDEDTGIIRFNASTTSDTSGEIMFYNWSWGSGEEPDSWNNGTDMEIEETFAIAGTYNITLQVWDHAGHQANITKTFKVVAGEKPDLTVILELSNKRVEEGDTVKAKIVLRNIGDANVTNETDILIHLYEGGKLVKTRTHTGGLDMDENVYINISWKPGRGTHDIKVVVDPDINETDEIEGAIDELKTDGGGEDNNEANTSLVVEKATEDDITMYLAITAVVILGIVVLLIRKKRQDRKLEEKLVGKKSAKKEKKSKK